MRIVSDSGQVSDSSVNSGSKDVLSVLHALECDVLTRNVVKRLADPNHVNCLFDMIGQSDMLSYGTENEIYA